MATVKLIKMPHCPAKNLARGSDLAAGYDLKSAMNIRIRPGERVKIPTGIKLEMPAGMEAQVRPRSGMAINHGLTVINTPGTIDADFRGEIMVLAYNTNPVISAQHWLDMLEAFKSIAETEEDDKLAQQFEEWVESNTIQIFTGDRIAQLVFGTHEVPELEEVSELAESARGEGGMGSSGIK